MYSAPFLAFVRVKQLQELPSLEVEFENVIVSRGLFLDEVRILAVLPLWAVVVDGCCRPVPLASGFD